MRRRFYRPGEIVIGYDEAVLSPAAVAGARAAWTSTLPVRTMPFRRAEADPAAPLLVSVGGAASGSVPAPPAGACGLLARALHAAGVRPLRALVRVNRGTVIVRGDIVADDPGTVAEGLHTIPDLASLADRALGALPEVPHLITARFDAHERRWRLLQAHGRSRERGLWRRDLDA